MLHRSRRSQMRLGSRVDFFDRADFSLGAARAEVLSCPANDGIGLTRPDTTDIPSHSLPGTVPLAAYPSFVVCGGLRGARNAPPEDRRRVQSRLSAPMSPASSVGRQPVEPPWMESTDHPSTASLESYRHAFGITDRFQSHPLHAVERDEVRLPSRRRQRRTGLDVFTGRVCSKSNFEGWSLAIHD